MDKPKLVIIIGLPGSGKTILTKINYSEYNIYDDFINNFYNGAIISNLEMNIKVCITDPRLCDYNIFKKFINIFQKIIDKSNILLILFENNKDQCLINVKERNKSSKNKFVEQTIANYHEKYDINNYKNYNHTIIPVYTSNII